MVAWTVREKRDCDRDCGQETGTVTGTWHRSDGGERPGTGLTEEKGLTRDPLLGTGLTEEEGLTLVGQTYLKPVRCCV